MAIKIVKTSEGWQVWRDNRLIGVVSSDDDQLRVLKHGEWVCIGTATSHREIAELIENANLH